MLRSALLIAVDHQLDEADEIGERAVLVGGVAFEREVGAIELQQEAVADDRLVLDLQRRAQRIEVALEACRSARSARSRAMMPGDGAVRNGST